jgi:hypothetical protein
MLLAPIDTGENYTTVTALRDISIIDVDWGNFEVVKGSEYRALNWSGNVQYLNIKIGGLLPPMDRNAFATKEELREEKLKELGI